jgi:uncharacterized protein (TIGR00251 family)
VKLKLKVVPSSSRDSIEGWMGEQLKVKVKAAPEKGKANKAVIKLLQKTLKLPAGHITLQSGQTSPNKVVQIPAAFESAVKQSLAKYYGNVTKS